MPGNRSRGCRGASSYCCIPSKRQLVHWAMSSSTNSIRQQAATVQIINCDTSWYSHLLPERCSAYVACNYCCCSDRSCTFRCNSCCCCSTTGSHTCCCRIGCSALSGGQTGRLVFASAAVCCCSVTVGGGRCCLVKATLHKMSEILHLFARNKDQHACILRDVFF